MSRGIGETKSRSHRFDRNDTTRKPSCASGSKVECFVCCGIPSPSGLLAAVFLSKCAMSLKSIKCKPCSLLLSLRLGLGAVCMGERSHILAAAWPPVEDSARGNGRDERAAIAESFRKRLEFSNNLKYEVDVELVVANNVHGKPQGIIETSPFRRCRVWRLNGSFRVETNISQKLSRRARL